MIELALLKLRPLRIKTRLLLRISTAAPVMLGLPGASGVAKTALKVGMPDGSSWMLASTVTGRPCLGTTMTLRLLMSSVQATKAPTEAMPRSPGTMTTGTTAMGNVIVSLPLTSCSGVGALKRKCTPAGSTPGNGGLEVRAM